jgi:hypothetical protein
MQLKRFKTKPQEVQAIQWDGKSNISSLFPKGLVRFYIEREAPALYVTTDITRPPKVYPEDWIVLYDHGGIAVYDTLEFELQFSRAHAKPSAKTYDEGGRPT